MVIIVKKREKAIKLFSPYARYCYNLMRREGGRERESLQLTTRASLLLICAAVIIVTCPLCRFAPFTTYCCKLPVPKPLGPATVAAKREALMPAAVVWTLLRFSSVRTTREL